MAKQPSKTVIAPPLLAAIRERAARGEQSLLLLNRRGYAPVLACSACGWKSECPHCSAYRVFHKIDRTLRCHHCGFTQAVPRACPECGDVDLQTVGRGTERLEEHLDDLLNATLGNPNPAPQPASGDPAQSGHPSQPEPVTAIAATAHPPRRLRIARIDADSTRGQGELERLLAQVHAGEVDVLVGTQMIAKGHDFRRVSLVAALNPDGGLFSSDFRAPERLFSLLLQAAGRAGRDAQVQQPEVWVQTMHPQHPLFAHLKQHDFAGFAAQQLQEREQAGLPPYSFQALLRADARTQEAAQAFLQAASQAGAALAQAAHVTLYPPVPLGVQRVANVERAQMLVESASRPALQQFLAAWQNTLHQLRPSRRRATAQAKALADVAGTGHSQGDELAGQVPVPPIIRWLLDVDPILI